MSTVKIQGISTKIIRYQPVNAYRFSICELNFFMIIKDYGYSCRIKMSCFFVLFEAKSSITANPYKIGRPMLHFLNSVLN